MAVKAEGTLLAGRYRVLERLGTGGMATVFLCEDERLGRKVAVKRLHAQTPGDTARRFRREAKLGASLNHRNVVSIFDTLSDDEGLLIVMEYVDGENLAQLIRREGGLEPDRAVHILRGIANALDYAHAEGVVHRDIKPPNILIGADGEAKLVDLGIAMALEGTRITKSGAVLGTASYMAPEQVDGDTPTAAADIYSLAAVAFEALSGHKARVGRTPMEIATRIVSEPPPLLSDVWPAAPPAAVEAICEGMARDPRHRPASAGEFVDRLERGLAEAVARPQHRERASASAPPPPPPTTERPARATQPSVSRARPRWLVPAAIAVALAALLVGAVLLLASGDGDDPQPAGEQQGDASARGEERDDAPDADSGGSGEPSGGGSPAPDEPAPAPGEPSAAASPEEAVQSFYERSAADDFEGAWRLATPAFQARLGGYDAFVSQQSSLQSIEFEKLKAKGDRVQIRTLARHTDYTDHCTGTARTVQREGGWQIDGLDTLDCTKD